MAAYDNGVFLSFRTADTIDFTTDLNQTLQQAGIRTFMKEYEEQPPWIPLQGSRIAIIVFSQDYASSEFCLEELRNIMERRTTQALVVVPIFYNVDPSDVRDWEYNGGSYGEAMERHTQRFGNGDPVSQWRQALTAAANIPLRFDKADFGSESVLIGQIVARVRVAVGAYDHDVFLSSRANDGFTANLNQALQHAGIHTFVEEDEAQIQRSRMAIIVFSEDYASSTSRLDELLNIMKCHRTQAQLVMPIFYNVYPSDVHDLKGSYGEAMEQHNGNGNGDPKWRLELMSAAHCYINGITASLRNDDEIINHVVQLVPHELNRMALA